MPGPSEDIDKFGDLLALDIAVTVANGCIDTVGDMIAENFRLDPAERRLHSGDLRHDIDVRRRG